VTGIVINGHASEVHACSAEEQKRIADLALERVGDKVPVICGIYADSTALAKQYALSAEAAGAHAALIFPPNCLMFGGSGRAELAEAHISEIAGATSLPLVLFQFPAWTNMQIELGSLIRLSQSIERIVAIKDLCNDPRLHEKHIRTLQSLARPVSVMTTHSMWLAGSIAMGAGGIISGAGSVIADRQAALFAARGTQAAFKLAAEMDVLVEALYGAPYVDWQARMKELLFRFGRFPTSAVRPPLRPISDDCWKSMQRLSIQSVSTPTRYTSTRRRPPNPCKRYPIPTDELGSQRWVNLAGRFSAKAAMPSF
jgi:4-hydroxy-tetrahydrodipicolinate synthase